MFSSIESVSNRIKFLCIVALLSTITFFNQFRLPLCAVILKYLSHHLVHNDFLYYYTHYFTTEAGNMHHKNLQTSWTSWWAWAEKGVGGALKHHTSCTLLWTARICWNSGVCIKVPTAETVSSRWSPFFFRVCCTLCKLATRSVNPERKEIRRLYYSLTMNCECING